MQEGERSAAIKVYVRVRPLVGNEVGSNEIVTVEEDCKTVRIATDAVSVIETKFDEAIPKECSQRDVFNLFKDYLPKVPEGYNLTVFAYGQTGSGKTYTMFGSDWENSIAKRLKQQHQNTFFEDLLSDENYAGLIPRTIYGLFEQIKQFSEGEGQNFNIYCSFLQIYNEKIYDLLQDFPKPKALSLHQSKLDGIFVEGLAEYAVKHYLDCLELMKRGEKNRFIRQTSMNTKSSRSHTIFQILLESTHPDSKGMFRKARLNLCDLAGSEKVNKSEDMGEQHFKELKNINQSLTTLGKVIACLSSQQKKKGIAAFRESKLTRLLQDSLTGNTFTFIVGNISPSANNIDQTINTLKFVERARHIVMKVKPMEFNGQNMEIVNKLQKEIQYLKQLLNLKRKGMNPDDIHNKLVSLQEENEKLKKTSVSIQDVERLIDENRKMKLEIYKLQVTQYGHTQFDNDAGSEYSAASYQKSKGLDSTEGVSAKPRLTAEEMYNDVHEQDLSRGHTHSKMTNGFEISEPHIRSPGSSGSLMDSSKFSSSGIKKALLTAGKSSVEGNSIYSSPSVERGQRKKEKQKILDKLNELERIQKFNEEKLMMDLEQLQKKNMQVGKNANSIQLKKRATQPPGTSEKRPAVNYEDKIRELEAKLFGK